MTEGKMDSDIEKSYVEQNYVISINKEGEWFYNGAEIIHPKVLRIFNDALARDENGVYYLTVEGDYATVVVEDAPFVVKRISPVFDGDDVTGFVGKLSDDTYEPIDLRTVEIDERNVPYCAVKRGEEKRGRLTARFSTIAYYTLASYIDYDEAGDSYFIILKSKRFDIPYFGGD
ncbi:MAG: DUF1285 domain-containing protein [Deltaproteobacteria bacterium]|uniref:DUF1285 domain-containing protein n=1 Tax=Candidatus Zymogenus saltonus TaxID=2844893 RepID=A0A9D8KGI6_9DELT|nr:DUF1285 domain-containing protein [Candidatus Zymogenus saltonus]